MKSEIKNIRTVLSYGAYGNRNAMGYYIYGKRPDGKTVRCKNKISKEGSIEIWSEYYDQKDDCFYGCKTEFTAPEWQTINSSDNSQTTSNKILELRRK